MGNSVANPLYFRNYAASKVSDAEFGLQKMLNFKISTDRFKLVKYVINISQ